MSRLDQITQALTRRSFLKTAAAATGTIGAISLTSCAPITSGSEEESDASLEGEWRPYRCVINNCAASCISYALIQDGIITKSRTDESDEDSWECPQYRGCLRGAMRRKIVYAEDRLKYPMKRVNWQPGGEEINGHLRGKDEWERITWDEALDMIATEMKRIVDTYSSEAIFRTPYIGSVRINLLTLLGGCWAPYGTGSQGGWAYPVRYMTGVKDVNVFWDAHLANDRMDLMNSNLIVFWGANPSWSSLGLPNHIYQTAKDRGVEIIVIDPVFSNTAAAIADQWIPIRPSTDTAMLLACAFVMIDEDLQDQEFLDTYCIGFDADHMPEGEDLTGNFKDYVLGTYDGTPKTPEWASSICGVDSEVIYEFARKIATVKPLSFLSGAAPARTVRGEQFAQAFLTVGWMTGNVGKPGAQVADNYHIMSGNGGNPLVSAGDDGTVNLVEDDLCDPYLILDPSPSPLDANMGLPMSAQWESIINGEFVDGTRGMREIDIHMIYDIGPFNTFNQQPGTLRAVEAYRKVDFVVSSDSFFSAATQYADIVLPIATNWERYNEFGYLTGRDALTYTAQMIDPLYETRTDRWVEAELARRLDLDESSIWIEPNQMFYNQLAGATVIKEDGSGYETLLTITEDDLAELGVEGEAQEGRISYQQFKQDGIYKVRRSEDDNLHYIAFEDFVADPEANPVDTESGKLEIYSRRLAEVVADFGSYEIAPIAQYIAPEEGYESTFEDFEQEVKSSYPLQLITVHYFGRMHSTLANSQVLRESAPHELFISEIDAAERNIENGDAVKVWNDRGAILRTAKVTSRLLPGVVVVGEGGWFDYDEDLEIDRGGCTNTLTRHGICGSGIQPYNSNNVQVERWGEEIQPDYLRPLPIASAQEE